MQREAGKTFILGIGAQKAGTTWFSEWLRASGQFAAEQRKEYHTWSHLLALGQGTAFAALPPERYFDHFEALIEQSGGRVAADITPAYSGLEADVFALIYNEFTRRGIACKVVFLMRDPALRCWSMARMNHIRRRTHNVDFSDDPDAEEILRRIYRTRGAMLRTRYDQTITRLEQVVPRADIHYGIYEALFDRESGPDELASLARFLDLPVQPEMLARRVQPFEIKPQQGDNKLASDVLADVVRFYAEVYAFCRQRFPETRGLWPGNRLLAERGDGDMQTGA